MTWLFASGHAVDVVLVVLLGEAFALIGRRHASAATIALALLPGALILLAVRAALTGGTWPWVALPLAASLPVHLLDVRRRGLWSAPGRELTTSASTSDRR